MYTDPNAALVDAIGLTPAQSFALRACGNPEAPDADGWSTVGIPVTIKGTTTALERLGLIQMHYAPDLEASGTAHRWRWRLTDAGRAALAALDVAP